ncbi:hypothetical protein CEXT_86031, partial [Caerostris extrusa]
SFESDTVVSVFTGQTAKDAPGGWSVIAKQTGSCRISTGIYRIDTVGGQDIP